jgi:hypothetical protein
MKRSPSYYRARNRVIGELISSLNVNQSEKSNDIILLRNGVFPEKYNEEQLVGNKVAELKYYEETLSFFDLTRFNTWFTLYPEKVCGKEVVTTSIEFPITIKGTKEDILNTIHIETTPGELELQALAIEVELQLLEL